jgi:hypothetical protein
MRNVGWIAAFLVGFLARGWLDEWAWQPPTAVQAPEVRTGVCIHKHGMHCTFHIIIHSV